MPIDDELPPSRLLLEAEADQFVWHFPTAFGVRVDLEGLDALPAVERLSLSGARLLEPPEAVLLDRVLQLVPVAMLAAVERIVIVQTRGTARYGASRNGIVRLSAQEARVREGDRRYGNRFSLFTTTLLHEIGHLVFEASLTPEQQGQVLRLYLEELDSSPYPPPDEPSQQGLEHYFIRFFVAALLGRGEPPLSGSAARRRLDEIGLTGQPASDGSSGSSSNR